MKKVYEKLCLDVYGIKRTSECVKALSELMTSAFSSFIFRGFEETARIDIMDLQHKKIKELDQRLEDLEKTLRCLAGWGEPTSDFQEICMKYGLAKEETT